MNLSDNLSNSMLRGIDIEDDVFLASFPRSGNTWARFLIANIYNTVAKKFDEIDFYNIHEIVPEYGTEVQPVFDGFPKVFKTHAHYEPRFKHVILLLRNPFDSLYSRCDMLNNNRGLAISLEETVRHAKYGITAIVEHTNSFIKHCDHLLIITYEHLQEVPQKELSRMCEFLQLRVTDAIMAEAIQKSSFPVMSRIEIEKGRKFGNSAFTHIRSGRIDQGQEVIIKDNTLYREVINALKKSPVLYLLYS